MKITSLHSHLLTHTHRHLHTRTSTRHTHSQALPPPLSPLFSLTLFHSHSGASGGPLLRKDGNQERTRWEPGWRAGGARNDPHSAQRFPGLQDTPAPNPRSPSTLPPAEWQLGGALL